MTVPIYATWCLSNNLGDAINCYLIERWTGQKPVFVDPHSHYPKYMLSGSILNWATPYTIVWGAGFANRSDVVNIQADIRAVRGPLTADRVGEISGNKPGAYGDPVSLMPSLYMPSNIKKAGKIGVIPHYLHQQEVWDLIKGQEEYEFINIFEEPESFVDKLLGCEKVLCSSLHAIILANAYKVPFAWFETKDPLGGDRTKFYDFFLSCKFDRTIKPHTIYEITGNPPKFFDDYIQPAYFDSAAFSNCCPFKDLGRKIRLSILICHLNDREKQLNRLMEHITPQLCPEVEVLVETDSGELSVGKKRNILLEKAKGDYVAFVDDDDQILDLYIPKVLNALRGDPDVVGMTGHYVVGVNDPEVFKHSIKYDHWYTEAGIHYRCPNHLNPVRRELALKIKYPEQDVGEDHEYSTRLFELLKGSKEVMIDDTPLYWYLK